MSFSLIKDRVLLPWSSYRSALPAPIRSIAEFNSFDKLDVYKNRAVCLTFDDGPDPLYTPKILNLLTEYDVKATFFVMGEAVENFPHLVEQIVKAGHTIGNHTYSHRHPWIMTSARAIDEVAQTTHIIKNVTGIAPRWFRPPFGRLRRAMCQQAHMEQMVTVLWSHSIIDWGPLGTCMGISQRLNQIKADDIVLMHDGKREHNHPEIMLQCLPEFLSSLEARSLLAVTLDHFNYAN